jgi:hypothetical protein
MDMGAVLFIATSLLIGMVTVPWAFLLSFGILMSMALAVFQVPLVSAITLWFQKHLGVAMASSSMLTAPTIGATRRCRNRCRHPSQ